jgi:hypothetical protein
VDTAETEPSVITFKSVGHLFATAFQKVVTVIPKIEATEGTVETVTAKVPVYGPLALPVEKAAYAILGEIGAVLSSSNAAGKQKLQDAGLDINVITTVEELLKSIPQIVTLAKTL